jgi:hypothetical protein
MYTKQPNVLFGRFAQDTRIKDPHQNSTPFLAILATIDKKPPLDYADSLFRHKAF